MATAFTPLRRTLRTYGFRIALLYIGLLGACVLMIFGVIFWVTEEFMEVQLGGAIGTEAASLVDGFEASDVEAVASAITRRIESPDHEASYYLLQDPSGRKAAGNLPAMHPTVGWYELPIPTGEDAGEHSDRLMAQAQLLPNGWFLVVGRDIDQFTDYEDLILNVVAASLAAAFALAVIGGLATSASLLRRVSAITDAGRDIMSGNLSRRIELRGNGDEFDRLSANLNEMLDRIEMLMEGLRQVSNDIAHDLRTPLSRLRQRLEGARAKAKSVVEYEAAVDNALAETDDILDTFGALLRIAQIESGTRRAAFATVDLSGVLQAIVETYGAVAEDHQHSLDGRIPAGIAVRGDRQLLTQMFANLVENALRHTPAGTRIELALSDGPAGPVCAIADDGPGIPEKERQKVFRRFYRLNSSRAAPGSGLGLSLVAAIAELHRIAVAVDDNKPGVRVILQFPPPETAGSPA